MPAGRGSGVRFSRRLTDWDAVGPNEWGRGPDLCGVGSRAVPVLWRAALVTEARSRSRRHGHSHGCITTATARRHRDGPQGVAGCGWRSRRPGRPGTYCPGRPGTYCPAHSEECGRGGVEGRGRGGGGRVADLSATDSPGSFAGTCVYCTVDISTHRRVPGCRHRVLGRRRRVPGRRLWVEGVEEGSQVEGMKERERSLSRDGHVFMRVIN